MTFLSANNFINKFETLHKKKKIIEKEVEKRKRQAIFVMHIIKQNLSI